MISNVRDAERSSVTSDGKLINFSLKQYGSEMPQ